MAFLYKSKIESHLIDAMGHVNHASYLSLFEDARWHLLYEQGMTRETLVKGGIGLVILEAHIFYLKELKEGEEFHIHTEFEDSHAKVWGIQQKMLNRAGDTMAEIRLKGGLFDLKNRKLVKADEDWRRLLLGGQI